MGKETGGGGGEGKRDGRGEEREGQGGIKTEGGEGGRGTGGGGGERRKGEERREGGGRGGIVQCLSTCVQAFVATGYPIIEKRGEA